MATVNEEYSKIQLEGKHAMAGESLTNDPEQPYPWEKPPKYTSVHEATEYLWETFIEEDTYINLMQAVKDGVSLFDITRVILTAEFQKGAWNPDLMFMLFEPVMYMIMALAERANIPMTIYEGDEEDDIEESEMFDTKQTEDNIIDLIKKARKGSVPEGVLTPEMKEDIEELPELNESLLERPMEQTEIGLLARPAGE
tara:strand:- start:2584 stop:3177 length:594 start_codon:yes stop_codon:yes gene_type:complete